MTQDAERNDAERNDAERNDTHRIDALEMRLAEQERVIEDLDAAVTAQWTAVGALQRQLGLLVERLADAERRLPDAPDAPPPHY
ncbi:SlyX family protein [Lichenibacterium ramalinae]|uniref:Protein SlyX homolog n=1 Tax=Lichenibacterium ramalinae TaxID=2316527 RepID=A0A4Q2REP5_9HYPH|nr:SlyX family protein [Lichenibacterium ramalinae]RYB04715.1 SlyX family protein [Lichenibacterium ramalinae]